MAAKPQLERTRIVTRTGAARLFETLQSGSQDCAYNPVHDLPRRSVTMTMRTKLIRYLDVGLYGVEVESVADHRVSSFVFRIEGQGEVLVVKPPPEFIAYIQNRLETASPLMEAVLAFHRGQNLAL